MKDPTKTGADEKSTPPEETREPPHRRDSYAPPLFEWALPEGIKKRIEAGLDSLTRGDRGKFREMFGELKMPREFYNFMLSQVDETKGAILKMVGKEFREFLERTNLAEEFSKILTKLSFEVRTEVRFRPNDETVPRPEIKTQVAIHGRESKPAKSPAAAPKTAPKEGQDP